MRLPSVILGFLITVASPLLAQVTVTTKSLPFGGLFQDYNATLAASGGSGNYSWSIITGNPPPGINFDPAMGELFGNPNTAGTFTFTVQVIDTQTPTLKASKQLSIGIMQITTPTRLPDANTCTAYSLQFALSDAPPPPFNWTVTDSELPPGFSLDARSGVLSGMPTTAGSFSFTIVVTSTPNKIYAIQGFSINVSSLCFLTTSLPDGDLNSFYRQSLIASGGVPPYTFGIKSGNLPTGLSLDTKSGLISGTPTAIGTYTFSLEVSDSLPCCSTTIQSYSVKINPELLITSTSPIPPGTAGAAYSYAFTATGGSTPYVFTTSNPPAGLDLSSAGVLSGIPLPGSYSFTVTLSDGGRNSISKDFKFTVITAGPVLQVSPLALTFNAVFEGDSPTPQFIDVTPVGTEPVDFRVQLDGGSVDSPAPSWISVTPVSATAPARLLVTVNQGSMVAQTTSARVRVNDLTGNAIIVMVTLNIAGGSPQLQVVPDTLHFAARSGTPGTLEQTLGIRSTGGGGPVVFSTFVQNNSTWISGVTPGSGQTVPNATVFLKVQVNTQGLQVGSYHDVILFSSNAATIQVPVALFVSANGAILDLNVTGIRFQARTGGGFSNPQTVQIFDIGDPNSSLTWSADLMNGSDLFSISTSNGTATPNNPGSLMVTPNADALQKQAGGYYGLLKITSTQAQNSPLYVVLVLDLTDPANAPLPDPSPGGLVFVGTAGKPLSAGQIDQRQHQQYSAGFVPTRNPNHRWRRLAYCDAGEWKRFRRQSRAGYSDGGSIPARPRNLHGRGGDLDVGRAAFGEYHADCPTAVLIGRQIPDRPARHGELHSSRTRPHGNGPGQQFRRACGLAGCDYSAIER